MTLILDGVDYGSVLNSAGARGFFGEGYFWHRFVPGLDYTGSTFVAKTATWTSRQGNMPLNGDLSPRQLKPDCIRVYMRQGMVLNAVGLSNPGVQALCHRWKYQGRSAQQLTPTFHPPWMISVAAVGTEPDERAHEIRMIADVLRDQGRLTNENLPRPFALQLNLSCPNTGHDQGAMIDEAHALVEALRPVNAPVLVKINVLVTPALATQLPGDGLIVSNTIPWGQEPVWGPSHNFIFWSTLFRTSVSPLAHLGGGGLSGRPLHDIVLLWLRRAREAGYSRPIVAGGGILGPCDAVQLRRAGADAVELGSISILRPWRVKKTIEAARNY